MYHLPPRNTGSIETRSAWLILFSAWWQYYNITKLYHHLAPPALPLNLLHLNSQLSSPLSPDVQSSYIENRVLSDYFVATRGHLSDVVERLILNNKYIQSVMPSQPAEAAHNRTISLLLMPPELVTKIFCRLSSFSDVFALSATCRQLRYIWFSNVTPIYSHVAPRSIACATQARKFLNDQGALAVDYSLSAENVVQLVRNSSVVEKAVQQFEREIVCRVRSKLKHYKTIMHGLSLYSDIGCWFKIKPMATQPANTMVQGHTDTLPP